MCVPTPLQIVLPELSAADRPIDSIASSQNPNSNEYQILCNKVCMKFLPATIPQRAELHDTDL